MLWVIRLRDLPATRSALKELGLPFTLIERFLVLYFNDQGKAFEACKKLKEKYGIAARADFSYGSKFY